MGIVSVSIDQLKSPVPGFVPIAKGQPAVHQYDGALVLVDHASDFMYVHMHQHLTMDKMLDAKHAFERRAEQHGVRSSITIVIMDDSLTKHLWICPGCTPNDHFLRCWCAIPKQDNRNAHLGHHQKRLHLPPTCSTLVAQSYSC